MWVLTWRGAAPSRLLQQQAHRFPISWSSATPTSSHRNRHERDRKRQINCVSLHMHGHTNTEHALGKEAGCIACVTTTNCVCWCAWLWVSVLAWCEKDGQVLWKNNKNKKRLSFRCCCVRQNMLLYKVFFFFFWLPACRKSFRGRAHSLKQNVFERHWNVNTSRAGRTSQLHYFPSECLGYAIRSWSGSLSLSVALYCRL